MIKSALPNRARLILVRGWLSGRARTTELGEDVSIVPKGKSCAIEIVKMLLLLVSKKSYSGIQKLWRTDKPHSDIFQRKPANLSTFSADEHRFTGA